MAAINCLVDELRDAAFELDAVVARSGLSGKFTSTCRSHAEQERLYRSWITGRAKFPAALPGSSAHEYGEAFDYLVDPYEYQSDVGNLWISWGGEWGGRSDPVHFELPGASARAAAQGQNFIAELAQKYNDLPWWATIALPVAATTTSSGGIPRRQEGEGVGQWLCRTTGLFC